jgi:hypothetical protein
VFDIGVDDKVITVPLLNVVLMYQIYEVFGLIAGRVMLKV